MRNLGDELMLRCLVRWMSRRDPPRVTVLSERPDECTRTSALPAIQNVPLLGQWAWYDAWCRGAAWRLLRELRAYDGFVGGGGDVLRDDRGWKHLSFATEKYFVAHALGTPWYVLNAGIGPPQTGYGRRLLRFVLHRARQVVVRDRAAYELALALRGPAGTWFAGDIVLALPRLFPDECRATSSPPLVARPYVLVCLRGNPDAFGRFALTEARLGRFAAALDTLADQGLRIAFLPFQQHDTEDDDTTHRALSQRMRRRDAVTFVPWTVDIATIAALFRDAALAVAMRLHAAVVAEAFGTPTVVLPYDRKLGELARQRALPMLDVTALDDLDATRACLEDAILGRAAAHAHGPDIAEAPPHDWLAIDFAV